MPLPLFGTAAVALGAGGSPGGGGTVSMVGRSTPIVYNFNSDPDDIVFAAGNAGEVLELWVFCRTSGVQFQLQDTGGTPLTMWSSGDETDLWRDYINADCTGVTGSIGFFRKLLGSGHAGETVRVRKTTGFMGRTVMQGFRFGAHTLVTAPRQDEFSSGTSHTPPVFASCEDGDGLSYSCAFAPDQDVTVSSPSNTQQATPTTNSNDDNPNDANTSSSNADQQIVLIEHTTGPGNSVPPTFARPSAGTNTGVAVHRRST